jgi:Large polyvalent protein associated domain 29
MDKKVYSLFGKNGMMEEIKPVGELPIGTKVFAFGYGNSEQIFCITSGSNQHNQQEMCLISNYYEGAYFPPRTMFDKYSKPISKKFGIGFYWDDIENVVFPTSKVDAAKRRVAYLELKISERENLEKIANKKELEALPGMYPHLKPIGQYFNGYQAEKSNLASELKKCFPNQKFSLKKSDKNSILQAVDICWTDGVTEKEVRDVVGKFVSYENDITGDFRDYAPSNFNRVFGGFKYVSEYRTMSREIEMLHEVIDEIIPNLEMYESKRLLREIWYKTSIPTNASNFRITRTDCTCGSHSDFYKLEFDLSESEKQVSENSEQANGIEVADYSDKSFVVYGNTRPIKETLKSLGGKFNMYLKASGGFTFAGWIFPMAKKEVVLLTLGL